MKEAIDVYRAFYGLTGNPFAKDIPVDNLYQSQDYKQFKGRMEYFKTARGFAVAYGRPGMGKTTCIRAYTSALNPQLFKVVYLALSQLTIMEFYRNLAMGLGLVPSSKKVDMFHQIQDHIINLQHQKNQTPFIILDEAQLLGGGILNELRMLFNFQMDSKNHAMVLLCGQPAFVSQLNLHIHEPLRQRISVHHEFTGLRSEEVEGFITTLLGKCGVTQPIFAPDAMQAIASASQGCPRLICSLAEKALMIGAQEKLQNITADTIQAAYEATMIFTS